MMMIASLRQISAITSQLTHFQITIPTCGLLLETSAHARNPFIDGSAACDDDDDDEEEEEEDERNSLLFLMATFLMMKALMGVSHSFAEFPNLLCLHLICRNVPESKRVIVHV